jgi:hypothetical protein
MWAHYAQDHTGLVFQFHTDDDFFQSHFIRPVSYAPHSKNRPLFRKNGDIQHIFLRKSVEWKYEAEWRIFRSLDELRIQKLDNGKDGYFADFSAKHISAIFFGCRISPPDKERTLAELSLPGRDHIEAFQARLHPKRYSLIFSPINRKGVT